MNNIFIKEVRSITVTYDVQDGGEFLDEDLISSWIRAYDFFFKKSLDIQDKNHFTCFLQGLLIFWGVVSLKECLKYLKLLPLEKTAVFRLEFKLNRKSFLIGRRVLE